MPKVEYIITVKVDDQIVQERAFTLDPEMYQGEKHRILMQARILLVKVFEDVFRKEIIENGEVQE